MTLSKRKMTKTRVKIATFIKVTLEMTNTQSTADNATHVNCDAMFLCRDTAK